MKLKKREIKKISLTYNLGKVESVKEISGGMINYNFLMKTSQGKFVVRQLGYHMGSWQMNKKKLEFGVIEYLRQKGFPYELPEFLKNKNGNEVSKIYGKLFEVYPFISGELLGEMNDAKLKEIVKLVALYHKFVKDFPIEKRFKWSDNNKWMLDKYKKMRKIKPKNNLDRLMFKHIDFFEDLLKKLLKVNLQQNLLISHSDFNLGNILWKKGKIIALLDFENVWRKPKLFDISYIWKDYTKKKLIIGTYRKYNSLSKREEKNMIVYKLLQKCNNFWWSYLGMKKRPELKEKWILDTVKKAKQYLEIAQKEGLF